MPRFFILFLSFFVFGYAIGQNKLKRLSLYFQEGSYMVNHRQQERLNQFVLSLGDLHRYEIKIQGHTDSLGDHTSNQLLSQRRSKQVAEQLQKYPVSRKCIHIKNFGESRPVQDNATLLGRMQNRRVEILFLPIHL